ncbi:MAG: DUF58 domain-containing protein [Planctomycetia bacterium]|jgi:uncharacterized protein (DUF58 family)|nr:DUF58 domain-containing protein [Planctomycetia bacterium]MCC7315875.1 DUF58 domain-containing protein [Planctomycetota bacterium]OQZ06828.1 MAG: hypothetical protein B6D36_03005 [Planctomycetes bacterium UTPLA1]
MADALFDKDFLKKLEYLDLIARRLIFGRQQALRASVKKGASIEFKDFREYSPGDDPRTVDWAVYARLGELVIKLYRQEEELDLWILLDGSGSMTFGEPSKFDHARRIAAALAYIGMSNMDSAGVVPFSADLKTGRTRMRGRGKVFGLLEYLQQLRPDGRTDLVSMSRAFVSRVRRPSLIVILSDFYGLQSARRALDQLRFFKHQLYVIQMTSAWELDPPIRGELRLQDSESSEIEDLTITDSMLRRYKQEYDRFGKDLRAYSMRHAIGYAQTRSDTAFDNFIRDILQRGGLLS